MTVRNCRYCDYSWDTDFEGRSCPVCKDSKWEPLPDEYKTDWYSYRKYLKDYSRTNNYQDIRPIKKI